MILSNQTAFARFLIAALFVGLFATTGRSGDDPPAKSPWTPANVERFRTSSAAERLKMVERLAGKTTPFTAVVRGDLVASIVERGAVEPVNVADMACKVKPVGKEGAASTTIKWLIDDGSHVKKGDRLAQLDDSAIRDQLVVARVKATQAEAAKIEAANALELAKIDNEIEVRLAQIEVKLAEQELKDPPPGQKKQVLELKLERARLLYERAAARLKGQLKQVEAEFQARSAASELEQRRLKEKEVELAQCVLTAPMDGIAIYYVPETGRFGGAAAIIAPGEPVREGQKILRVVDLTKLAIATRIHESLISSVRMGQTAKVRIDAIPKLDLSGKVTQVSPVASPNDWRKTDVKVYPVTIALDNTPLGLKPGMTAEVLVMTGERKGVLQLPAKAIWTASGKRYCYVKAGDELLERSIVTGANNATMVEIKEGLKEGDLVLTDATVVMSGKDRAGRFERPALDR